MIFHRKSYPIPYKNEKIIFKISMRESQHHITSRKAFVAAQLVSHVGLPQESPWTEFPRKGFTNTQEVMKHSASSIIWFIDGKN